jgi:hypothetical protein
MKLTKKKRKAYMMKFVLMDATGAHDEEDQYNE